MRALWYLPVAGLSLVGCDDQLPNVGVDRQALEIGTGTNFGDVMLGDNLTQTISILPGPEASSEEIATITANCANFAVTPATLPAPVSRVCSDTACAESTIQSADFSVVFTPRHIGPDSCYVTATLVSGQTKIITLVGNGTGPADAIAVEDAMVEFGDVRVGNPTTRTLRVRNVGTAQVTLGAHTEAINSAIDARSLDTMMAPLAPNAAFDLEIKCTPSLTELATNTLTITAGAASVSVPMTCNGTATPVFTTPVPVQMRGPLGVPQQADVTVRNTAGVAVTLMPTFTSSGFTAPVSVEVAANGMATLAVANDGATLGVATATMDYGATTGASPVLVVSRTELPGVTMAPAQIAPTCVGATRLHTIELVANGDADVPVESVSVAAPFEISIQPVPTVLKGRTATKLAVEVAFVPTEAGEVIGAVAPVTVIPSVVGATYPISAVGLAAGVSAWPATAYFGINDPLATSAPQTVTLGNCGADPLAITEAVLAGPAAADFVIAEAPTTAIAPMETGKWIVTMRATTPGTKRAELVITHALGETRVPLVGDVLASDVNPTDDEKVSYYTCRVAGDNRGQAPWPGLLAPLFAIWFAVRRRRA